PTLSLSPSVPHPPLCFSLIAHTPHKTEPDCFLFPLCKSSTERVSHTNPDAVVLSLLLAHSLFPSLFCTPFAAHSSLFLPLTVQITLSLSQSLSVHHTSYVALS